MKKGRFILLSVCILALTLVVGIFIGRNLRENEVMLVDTPILIEDSSRLSEPVSDMRLDLNTATKIQLMELPGIGDVLAERILAYRTLHGSFASTDDLLNVEGIGEKTLQQMESLIRVGG